MTAAMPIIYPLAPAPIEERRQTDRAVPICLCVRRRLHVYTQAKGLEGEFRRLSCASAASAAGSMTERPGRANKPARTTP